MRKSHRWRRGSPSQQKKLGGLRPISPDFTHTRACAIDLGMVAQSLPTSPTSSDAGFRGRANPDLISAWRRTAPWPPCFLAGVQQENWDEGLQARGGCGHGKEVEEQVSPAGGRWKSSGRGQWGIFRGWKPCGQRQVRAGGLHPPPYAGLSLR
jgi:hypothetical protein